MGVGLSYSVSQVEPFTPEQHELLQATIDAANAADPGHGEPLAIFASDDGGKPSFAGSSDISPDDDEDVANAELLHWLGALSDMRRHTPSATWDVTFEGLDVAWDDVRGYFLEGLS